MGALIFRSERDLNPKRYKAQAYDLRTRTPRDHTPKIGCWRVYCSIVFVEAIKGNSTLPPLIVYCSSRTHSRHYKAMVFLVTLLTKP